MSQCPSCFGRQDAGLLCSDCCAICETLMAAVPGLVTQLDLSISKQARVGSGGKSGKGTARETNPINFGALAAKDALLVAVAFVGDDIDALRKHPQVAELVCDLGRTVKAAYRAIDRAQERQYMGRCLNTVGEDECQAELWAKPKAGEVECRLCGYVHDVADRRLDMLEMARDQVCTPKEAANYVGEVGGIAVGHQRIRNYLDRGRIAARPSPDGVKRLRLGDLLDVLGDDAARHDAKAS